MNNKLDKKTIKLLKKFASSPAGKTKHKSTGFPELDKMIDETAERMTKEINESPELLKAWIVTGKLLQ